MLSDGALQRDADSRRPNCPIRDRLEKDVYSAIQMLARHSSTLVGLVGKGKLDLFIETTRHCEEQRLLIQELEKQIAIHRAEHGC